MEGNETMKDEEIEKACKLAQAYARDGAFLSEARVFKTLAEDLTNHANRQAGYNSIECGDC